MSTLVHESYIDNIDNLQQFEALFNFATIGIVVTNNEGTIINFNRYAETQFGYTKDEILGHTVDALLPPAAHRKHKTYREQYYVHPEPRIMGHGRDLFAQNKNGTTFPVEVSLSHYKIKDETFVIAFVVDITVRKKQEATAREQTYELEEVSAKIKSLNQELEQKVEDRTKMLREALLELEVSKEELSLAFEKEKELSELKSRFSIMASHEFRTPLSTILSSAYLLGKYNELLPDSKAKKHILRIEDAVEGMKTILEDFLSLGKLEEGLVRTNNEWISPDTMGILVNDLVELGASVKSHHEVVFTNELKEKIWIDKNLVKNVFINLLSNAIKFTGEQGIIKVTASLSNNNFIISVADNGIGISEEDQQHLFERFFRAKNAVNIQGTGLGLHIVARYLQLMDGTITMQSKLHEGTTVTVAIPQPLNDQQL